MGEHIYRDPKKKKIKEHDTGARRTRVTFKNYLRALEEELLEEELDATEEQPEDNQDD
jgi:hypothetical protein